LLGPELVFEEDSEGDYLYVYADIHVCISLLAGTQGSMYGLGLRHAGSIEKAWLQAQLSLFTHLNISVYD